MPWYSLVCLSVHNKSRYDIATDLVKKAVQHVINQGGAVRSIQSSGTRVLPQRMRSHKVYHQMADYWSMDFDAGPTTLRSLGQLLRRDPRVIRSTTLNLGNHITRIVHPATKTLPRET